MKIKRQDTSIPVFSYVMDIFLFSHPLHQIRIFGFTGKTEYR